MYLIALDFETDPIAPGMQAPPPVVLSWATTTDQGLILAPDHRPFLRDLLADPDARIIGANTAFDLAVAVSDSEELTTAVFDAYSADRIVDVQIVDQLLRIREGTLKHHRYNLSALSERWRGTALAKGDDTWRTRYAELRGVPIERWPEDAIAYSITDSIATLEVYQAQALEYPDYPPHAEVARQGRAAFALFLMRAWGVRSDPQRVQTLRARVSAELAEHRDALFTHGLLKEKRTYPLPGGKRGGSPLVMVDSLDTKEIKARVQAALGADAPLTDSGDISRSASTLLLTEDPILALLVQREKAKKLLDFLGVLDKAAGEHPFHPRWNVLVETGRTSCGGSEDPGNLQNQPRKGGVRECFIPDRGHAYLTTDVDCAELRSLSQVTYSLCGFSRMRDVFLQGPGRDDPHQALFEAHPDIIPDRQFAKIPNFGFPGGLGPKSLISYARGYGQMIDLEQAKALQRAFFAQWPEMRSYFAFITDRTDDWSDHSVEQYGSGRVRGQLRFTQAANTYFQGLTADGLKTALYQVTRECYDPSLRSCLYGSRPVVFVHDEIILEVPYEGQGDRRPHYQAERVQAIIRESFAQWTPDVPCRASSALMMRWYKGAKAVYTHDGYLMPWEPK